MSPSVDSRLLNSMLVGLSSSRFGRGDAAHLDPDGQTSIEAARRVTDVHSRGFGMVCDDPAFCALSS
jgi:hypothetical protein